MSHTRVIYSVKFTRRWWFSCIVWPYAAYLRLADKEPSEGFTKWIARKWYKTNVIEVADA